MESLARSNSQRGSVGQDMADELINEGGFGALEEYESDAYCWYYYDTEMEDGTKLKGARTFVWVDLRSKNSEDGKFDLEWFKKSVLSACSAND